MTVIGVEVPDAEAVGGCSPGGPPFKRRSMTSRSSLGLNCSHDMLLGALGMATARRYDGQHSISNVVMGGINLEACSWKYSLRCDFFSA